MGGQQEMDAEAAAALRDPDERRQEIGQLLRQCRELVDDHHESGQRFSGARTPVLGEITGRGGAQQPLSTADLRVEAHERSLGQPVVEIGDHTDDVGKMHTRVECRTALEVDQHERQVVGTNASGERHHERPQQLALAGARGARQETVRAVTYEIELDDTVGRSTDRCHQRRVGSSGGPAAGDRRRVERSADFAQREVGRQPDLVEIGGLGVDERCESAGGVERGDTADPGEVQWGLPDAVVVPPLGSSAGAEFENSAADRGHGRIAAVTTMHAAAVVSTKRRSAPVRTARAAGTSVITTVGRVTALTRSPSTVASGATTFAAGLVTECGSQVVHSHSHRRSLTTTSCQSAGP